MDDHTEAELKPCPFCGGAVNLEQTQDIFRDRETGTYRRWWGVICRNTENVGGSCAVSVRPSASKGAAVGRWNRRATQASAPADLVSALDRMDALLDHAAGLLAVPDDSATAKASRRDMALIRARLLAPATCDKPSPVDANASLIDAARAVVGRWHTPVWKEVEHTAAFIARLDEAVTRAAEAGPRAGFLDTENPQCDKGGPACEGCLMIGYCLGGEAAVAAPPAQQWLPIADAPKDGTELLLVDADGVRVVGRWGKHNHVPLYGWIRQVELYGEEVDGFDAVGWQPLPPAPQHQGGGNG